VFRAAAQVGTENRYRRAFRSKKYVIQLYFLTPELNGKYFVPILITCLRSAKFPISKSNIAKVVQSCKVRRDGLVLLFASRLIFAISLFYSKR